MNFNKIKIGIIGLGYVGLPLAVEFGNKRKVIAYDIDKNRIAKLKIYNDETNELSSSKLKRSKKLIVTNNFNDLRECNCYIITVPTPIKRNNAPDLTYLINSTIKLSKILKINDLIIYESTVYPGCLEEICVPTIEKNSGLKFNKEFFLGYSPERINPGDKLHTISKIKKITSGSTKLITTVVDRLYNEIIEAGTFVAESIKVAEAAKIIENTQRDINIALVNELSIIFNKMNIDTEAVLKAASTKWNFHSFTPGLVGGHCISVDPYYLTYKSRSIGYNPKMILAGREINDNMSKYVVRKLTQGMRNKNIKLKEANILIMGFTFKENCPDIRNTKVFDVYKGLKRKKISVEVYDPWVSKDEVKKMYNFTTINKLKNKFYDALIFAVPHNEFKKLRIEKIRSYLKTNHVIFDLKYVLKKEYADLRL